MRQLTFYLLLLLIAACSGTSPEPPVPLPPTQAALAAAQGERLPSGTLLVMQEDMPRALLPDGRAIALAEAQQGARGAPNGAFGILFVPSEGALDLALVDYNQNPPAVREIPDGRAMINPIIVWQPDSSGFLFYDFPLIGGLQGAPRALYYYQVRDGQTRTLLSAELSGGRQAVALAFSPNGMYLLYGLLREDSEALGAQSGAGYLLNLLGGQPIALPEGALLGFGGWLGDSSGFFNLRDDPQTGRGYLTHYRLAQLAAPQRLTADEDNVTVAASAPDGSQLVLAVRTADGRAALRLLPLDGTVQRELYRLPLGQSVSTLIWATPDAIYFSTSGSEGDRVWRIAPSDSEPTQLAEGALRGVVR
jgi:hypothetical protein